MKNSLLTLFVIFLFGSFTASAQTEKGSWFLNGLKILTFQTGTVVDNSSNGFSNTKESDFIIGPSFLNGNPSLVYAPTLNYCFTKNVSGGVFVNVSINSQADINSNASKTTYSVFAIGPTVRYTFVNKSKFNPFAEAKIGFGSIVLKTEGIGSIKRSLFEYYLGTGCTYFIKPKLGIDFSLGYRDLIMKGNDTQGNSKTTYSFVNMGVGMVVGL